MNTVLTSIVNYLIIFVHLINLSTTLTIIIILHYLYLLSQLVRSLKLFIICLQKYLRMNYIHEISMKISMKLIASTMIEYLDYIFNIYFLTVTIPHLFKKPKVIPIYKSDK